MEPTKLNLKAAYSKATEVATLRDYFAAAAMNGLLACAEGLAKDGKQLPKNATNIAHIAFSIADAMLNEREKSK